MSHSFQERSRTLISAGRGKSVAMVLKPTWWAWLVAFALAAAACSTDANDAAPGTTEAAITDWSTTTELERLEIIVSGSAYRQRICFSSAEPCLPTDTPLHRTPQGVARVRGTLRNGILRVIEQLPVGHGSNGSALLCPDAHAQRGLDYDQEIEDRLDTLRIEFEERTAGLWIEGNVFHLRVVGSATPARERADQLGIGDHVCIVGQPGNTPADWSDLAEELEAFLVERGLLEVNGRGPRYDPVYDDLYVGVSVIDSETLDAIAQRFGAEVRVGSALQIITGSAALLEEELAAVDDVVGWDDLYTRCARVVLDGYLPDITASVLTPDEANALAAGLLHFDWVEPYWAMSVPSSDGTTAVLLGRPPGIETPGPWEGQTFHAAMVSLSGRGQLLHWDSHCRLAVEAVGFDPTEFRLSDESPPDPASDHLTVLLSPVACGAHGMVEIGAFTSLVRETDSSVEIVILTRQPSGGVTCEGHPPVLTNLRLEAPLADRSIINFSHGIPEILSWPPSAADKARVRDF